MQTFFIGLRSTKLPPNPLYNTSFLIDISKELRLFDDFKAHRCPTTQAQTLLTSFISNQLIFRQGKSIGYELEFVVEKIKKIRKTKRILLINFLHC